MAFNSIYCSSGEVNIMKKLSIFLFSAFLFLTVTAGSAWAAPFNARNNPQIVANYPTGDHGVTGEAYLHNGADVVMRAGNSGNFQQWFYGYSAETGQITEGDHSLWVSVGSDTTCRKGGTLVENANQAWGDYLLSGNYCVYTNDYHVTK